MNSIHRPMNNCYFLFGSVDAIIKIENRYGHCENIPLIERTAVRSI